MVRSPLSHIQEPGFLSQQQEQQEHYPITSYEPNGITNSLQQSQTNNLIASSYQNNNMMTQKNSNPILTYVKPAPIAAYTSPVDNNNNLAKLNNYMEYQKLAPTTGLDSNKQNQSTGIWGEAKKSSVVDSSNKNDSEYYKLQRI